MPELAESGYEIVAVFDVERPEDVIHSADISCRCRKRRVGR